MAHKLQKIRDTGKREADFLKESDYDEDLIKGSVLSQRRNKQKLKEPRTPKSSPFLQNIFYVDNVDFTDFQSLAHDPTMVNCQIKFQNEVLKGTYMKNKSTFICQQPGIYHVMGTFYLKYSQTSDYIHANGLFLSKNGQIKQILLDKIWEPDHGVALNYPAERKWTLHGACYIELDCGDQLQLWYNREHDIDDGFIMLEAQGRFEGHWVGNHCRTEKNNDRIDVSLI